MPKLLYQILAVSTANASCISFSVCNSIWLFIDREIKHRFFLLNSSLGINAGSDRFVTAIVTVTGQRTFCRDRRHRTTVRRARMVVIKDMSDELSTLANRDSRGLVIAFARLTALVPAWVECVGEWTFIYHPANWMERWLGISTDPEGRFESADKEEASIFMIPSNTWPSAVRIENMPHLK